jgi:hypothetical protein
VSHVNNGEHSDSTKLEPSDLQRGQRPGSKPVVYTSPRLTHYGAVSKLTQNGNGTGTDGGPAGMNMNCL